MSEDLDRMRQMSGLTANIAVKRSEYQPETEIQTTPPVVRRSWRAGEWSDLTSDWTVSASWSYALIQQNLSTLRARARSEYRTNDYARRFVGMLKNGVVGPEGFQLQAQFEDARGVDVVANTAFETHWKRWAENPAMCDVRGHSNFQELCNQWMTQLPQDGELLITWHNRGEGGYQLQTIEPLALDVNYHEDLNNGRRIRFGIELDQYDAAVAYWFNVDSSAYRGDHYYNTGQRQRVEASRVYHVFLCEGVDQLRGFPWLSTPMYRMHMLDGYEEAAAVSARVGAAKMGFKKQRDPDRYSGEGGMGAGVEEIAPGVAMGYLNENEEWIPHNPDYPSDQFQSFVQQMLRGISSGLEVSYPTLANDLAGVNYTSLRHDALTERDVYMRLQRWLASHLLKPIYDDWLLMQFRDPATIPRIPRRGGGTRPASIQNMEKYRRVKFQGRRWQWVDPLKEIQAQREGIALGVQTRSQVIRDTGRDPEEVFLEWTAENERFGQASEATDTMAGENGADNRTPGDDPDGNGNQSETQDG